MRRPGRADLWAAAYQDLLAFSSEHGHLRVPAGYRGEAGIDLCDWQRAQRVRRKAGRMPAEQERLRFGPYVQGWVTSEMTRGSAMAEAAPEIDTSRPDPARIYDYMLGGKDHFAADREVADRVLARVPAVRTAARENRALLGRAVRYLAAKRRVRQFLDIGAGLPAADNVHEIAQRAAPESRVVYVDSARLDRTPSGPRQRERSERPCVRRRSRPGR
jgi:hypothetical protein